MMGRDGVKFRTVGSSCSKTAVPAVIASLTIVWTRFSTVIAFKYLVFLRHKL